MFIVQCEYNFIFLNQSINFDNVLRIGIVKQFWFNKHSSEKGHAFKLSYICQLYLNEKGR